MFSLNVGTVNSHSTGTYLIGAVEGKMTARVVFPPERLSDQLLARSSTSNRRAQPRSVS
jgi:hypothetical protein